MQCVVNLKVVHKLNFIILQRVYRTGPNPKRSLYIGTVQVPDSSAYKHRLAKLCTTLLPKVVRYSDSALDTVIIRHSGQQ